MRSAIAASSMSRKAPCPADRGTAIKNVVSQQIDFSTALGFLRLQRRNVTGKKKPPLPKEQRFFERLR